MKGRTNRAPRVGTVIELLSSTDAESDVQSEVEDQSPRIKSHKSKQQSKSISSSDDDEPIDAADDDSDNFADSKKDSQNSGVEVLSDEEESGDEENQEESDEEDREDEDEYVEPKKTKQSKATQTAVKSRSRRLSYDRKNNIADETSLIKIDDSDDGEDQEESEEKEQDDDDNNDNDKDDDSDSNSDEDDTSMIQVPNSSPQRGSKHHPSELDSSPPAKVTTKLPKLRSFEYSGSPSDSSYSLSSTDYITMKKSFPNLPAGTIMNALKKYQTISKTYHHLKSLEKPSSKSSSMRLDTLTSKRNKINLSDSPIPSMKPSAKTLILKSERLKKEEAKRKKLEQERASARRKAEQENIVSSKVVLDLSKKSLKDRYVSNRFANRKNVIHDDEEDDDEDENDEIIDSDDDSIEEISSPPPTSKSKRRYEYDDDYEVSSRSKRSKAVNRSVRTNKRAVVEDDDTDLLLPEFEINKDSNLNITQKVMKLFNNADIRDIIDISNIKPDEAKIVFDSRPYRLKSELIKLNVQPDKVKTNRFRNPMERYFETAEQKLTAYLAIDDLLKQCFSYSKSITTEIKKWGINLKGKILDGEIAITNVEVDSEEESEDESESSDEEIKEAKKYNKKKFRIDGSEFDDDFSTSKKKLRYKSSLDNSKTKDKIGYFNKKPVLLSDDISLKDYQQVGINWLHLLFKKQLSCILADEMGLGKTAQVIAFLSHLKKKRYPGPHLIVVPSSTLENWLREFEKFSPTLKVIPYYGSVDEREELKAVLYEEEYDVVVTTYNLAVGKTDSVFLQSMNFNVIVYDEGHMLKNAMSDRYKKLVRLKANFRLLLTGTPLQNNLKELISLLNFILPEIFDSSLDKLEYLFDQKATTKTNEEKIEGKNYNPLMSEQAINKAKIMMAPFVLRRTKAQVMKDLPEKHTKIDYCDLVPSQSRIYEEELEIVKQFRIEREKRKLLTDEENKKLPPLSKKSTNILMTLRKACMHPLLFRRFYTDQMLRIMSKKIMKNPTYEKANEQYIFEDFQVMTDSEITRFCHNYPNELGKFVLKQNIFEESGKVKKLVELLTEMISKGKKVLVFSLFTQMLDILENVLSLHNWKFLRLDGSTQVDTRQTIIDQFYDDKTIPVMLLSTKAGGFGINLVCANNVIIFDQSLNPHDDKQAEDRAHRVGQTEEVFVHRLIAKDSIEENILHLAFNKLQLDNSMMAQNVEDVLLKTVEDLIVSKNTKSKNKVREVRDEANTDEIKNENVFDAFEAPISEELAAADAIDEGIEITDAKTVGELNDAEKNGGRKRRARQKVNYNENGMAINDDLLIEETTEETEKYNKSEKKDANFSPEESPIAESKVVTLAPALEKTKEKVVKKVGKKKVDKMIADAKLKEAVIKTFDQINALQNAEKNSELNQLQNPVQNIVSNPVLNTAQNPIPNSIQNVTQITPQNTSAHTYVNILPKIIVNKDAKPSDTFAPASLPTVLGSIRHLLKETTPLDAKTGAFDISSALKLRKLNDVAPKTNIVNDAVIIPTDDMNATVTPKNNDADEKVVAKNKELADLTRVVLGMENAGNQDVKPIENDKQINENPPLPTATNETTNELKTSEPAENLSGNANNNTNVIKNDVKNEPTQKQITSLSDIIIASQDLRDNS